MGWLNRKVTDCQCAVPTLVLDEETGSIICHYCKEKYSEPPKPHAAA